MQDGNVTGGGAAPAASPPVVAPQAPQAPVQAQPQPTHRPVDQTVLDPNLPIEVPMADGTVQYATLQQLADRFRAPQQNIPADQLEAFQLFQRATGQNDTDAMMKLVSKYGGGTPPPPAPLSPAEQKIAALEAQLQAMQGKVTTAATVAEQIQDAQRMHTIRQTITEPTVAAKVPYLAKYEGGAEMVRQKLDAAYAQAKAVGIDLNTHPNRGQVVAQALQEANAQLQAMAQAFNGFNPSAPQQAKPGVQVVNDQQNQQNRTAQPAIRLVNGQPVDQFGRPMMQTRTGEFVPMDQVPMPGPTGAVIPAGFAAPNQPKTIDSMKASIRARQAELSGGNQ